MGKHKDLSNAVFGRLTVLGKGAPAADGRCRWLCVCECGNQLLVSTGHLTTGHTKSCGCYKADKAKARATHGGNRRGAREPLYDVWIDMRRRCYNPKDSSFKYYGGRGIGVCEQWNKDYGAFRAWAESVGYEPGLTIDRKDTDGDYSPENCRWATHKEQSTNKRNNHRLYFNGKNLTLSEWEEVTGIPQRIIRNRVVELGWPVEKALTQSRRACRRAI